MYDIEALRRRISKEGVDNVIKDLSSKDFSIQIKEELTKAGVFVEGVLNLTLIYSLDLYPNTVVA